MTSTSLSQRVDIWTCQAASASRFLAGLYRVLGDEKQAANAIQAGAPAEEMGRRYGLAVRIAVFKIVCGTEGDEVEGEAKAWELLVEAQAGIAALHAMAQGQGEKVRGLVGARNMAAKALTRAIRGYRSAFPEEMVETGIRRAVERAADHCATAFVGDLSELDSSEDLEGLRSAVREEVLVSLLHEVSPSPVVARV